jgi:hypothetical protein
VDSTLVGHDTRHASGALSFDHVCNDAGVRPGVRGRRKCAAIVGLTALTPPLTTDPVSASRSLLQPLDNPFGARLSPVSAVRSVTHVSGPDTMPSGSKNDPWWKETMMTIEGELTNDQPELVAGGTPSLIPTAVDLGSDSPILGTGGGGPPTNEKICQQTLGLLMKAMGA